MSLEAPNSQNAHPRRLSEVERITASGLFDADYYHAQRPRLPNDISRLIEDYLAEGWRAGADPSEQFRTNYYLTINDDVRAEGCNPLLHYIDYGKHEGRRPAPHGIRSRAVAVPAPVAPSDVEWDALAPSGGIQAEAPRIDVLVPVYGGYGETLRCLYSVLATPQVTPFRLLVVNDCSPDPEIPAALTDLASRGWIELLRTDSNLGFLGACNLGMAAHRERDIVLLNSDTEVYGDWLDRLCAAAEAPDVATVTPFSNNAEICSYPVFCEDNWRDLEIDDAELDRLASVVNRGETVEIPTGVGFCMYVKRACLDEIGMFDAASFGQGYGEENDLCRRALQAGWRNLMAVDVFVRHYGAVSFGERKVAKLRVALETLDRLHPDYQAAVAAFVAADPVKPFREALDLARLLSRSGRGAVLFVCHSWGGGTERHVQELAAALEMDGAPVFFCREVEGDAGRIQVTDAGSPDTVNLPTFDLTRHATAFADFLRHIGVRHIHIHNLAGMAAAAVDFFRVAARLANLAYDVTLHDYIAICPRIDLVDGSGVYCGEPAVDVCEACIARDGSRFGKPSVWQWRDRWTLLLEGARAVFAPDRDVAIRMRRHMPQVAVTVRPHAHLLAPARQKPKFKVARRAVRRVAVLGAIGLNKGSALLLDTARAAATAGLPLEFVVVGHTDRDEDLLRLGNVRITGRYPETEAVARVEAVGASLAWFPAVWPETFSYTLSIALEALLYPVVFELGALATRVSDLGWGQVLPLEAMLDPEALAIRLLEQPLPPPPADIFERLQHGSYLDALRTYYGLEGGDRLRPEGSPEIGSALAQGA